MVGWVLIRIDESGYFQANWIHGSKSVTFVAKPLVKLGSADNAKQQTLAMASGRIGLKIRFVHEKCACIGIDRCASQHAAYVKKQNSFGVWRSFGLFPMNPSASIDMNAAQWTCNWVFSNRFCCSTGALGYLVQPFGSLLSAVITGIDMNFNDLSSVMVHFGSFKRQCRESRLEIQASSFIMHRLSRLTATKKVSIA